jgi:hypothetical protein
MRFTFTKERSDNPMEDNQTNTTMEFKAIMLHEIVANFEDFLRGCGFRFDGVLDFVEDEDGRKL